MVYLANWHKPAIIARSPKAEAIFRAARNTTNSGWQQGTVLLFFNERRENILQVYIDKLPLTSDTLTIPRAWELMKSRDVW